MAQQENSSEINTSPTLEKSFLQSTIASLCNLFVFSKTLPSIGALVVSYKFVEIAVVSTLMNYLVDSGGIKNDQRMAVVLTNLHDGLSSILHVIVSLITEAYTGCFTMITFCAAASIQGLMLLWASAAAPSPPLLPPPPSPSPSPSPPPPPAFNAVYAAIFFLALGNSGQKLSEIFLEYQLQEKKEQGHKGTNTICSNIWLFCPTIAGYIITIYIAFTVNYSPYETSFRFAALLMGGTYLFFLFGCAWYRREQLTVESNLRKIYRIFKAAFVKRKSKYPTSADCYYWKDYKQKHLYRHGNGLRLLPRVPRLFRWLDKAAIVNAEEYSSDHEVSPETKEKKGKLCTVREVREVKSIVPMIYLGFAFFAYSLLLATGNTFFVSQASSMTSDITTHGNDISVLFLIKDVTSDMSRFMCFLIIYAFRNLRKLSVIEFMCKRKAGIIIRIGFGMICAVICSLIAWHVEVRRLRVNDKKDDKDQGRNSTVVLVPQFLLLGITEGLLDDGFASLFYGHVAKPMWSFEDSFSELVIGTGKLLVIPIVLIFSSWIKETVNTSHLDRFYLMLGILNAVFLLGFVYYSIRYAYKEECPQDEKVTMEHTLEYGHQLDSQDSSPANNNVTQPVMVNKGNKG